MIHYYHISSSLKPVFAPHPLCLFWSNHHQIWSSSKPVLALHPYCLLWSNSITSLHLLNLCLHHILFLFYDPIIWPSTKPVLARALPLSALLSFALSSRGELAWRNLTWTRFHITTLEIQLWSGFVQTRWTNALIKIRICWQFLFPYQRLPTRTVPTAMRRITTKDMSKLFSSSAVLGEGRK